MDVSVPQSKLKQGQNVTATIADETSSASVKVAWSLIPPHDYLTACRADDKYVWTIRFECRFNFQTQQMPANILRARHNRCWLWFEKSPTEFHSSSGQGHAVKQSISVNEISWMFNGGLMWIVTTCFICLGHESAIKAVSLNIFEWLTWNNRWVHFKWRKWDQRKRHWVSRQLTHTQVVKRHINYV